MSKYEEYNTLYTSKLNSDGNTKSKNTMNRADWHSMRLDSNNPNHIIENEINNIYQFRNENGDLVDFDIPKIKNETDEDYYQRRLEERKKYKDIIDALEEEKEKEFYKTHLGVNDEKEKKKITGLKTKAGQVAGKYRSKQIKTLTKKIEGLDFENDKDDIERLTSRKKALMKFADMLSNENDPERKELTQENYDEVLKTLKESFTEEELEKKVNQNLINKINDDFKTFKILNNTQKMKGANRKIRSTEVVWKIPDDNNITVEAPHQREYLHAVFRNLYKGHDILYMATHLDETLAGHKINGHTHAKISGFNNETKDFDIIDTEIKNLSKFAKSQNIKALMEKERQANIEYAKKEIEELEKALENKNNLTLDDIKYLNKTKKTLKETLVHLTEYTPLDIPTYEKEDEEKGLGKEGELKKWKHYSLPEQINHGVMFQTFMYESFKAYVKKKTNKNHKEYDPAWEKYKDYNFQKRSLEQKMIDKHDYNDRKAPILYRANNGQKKALELAEKYKKEAEEAKQAKIEAENQINTITENNKAEIEKINENHNQAITDLKTKNENEIKKLNNEIDEMKEEKEILETYIQTVEPEATKKLNQSFTLPVKETQEIKKFIATQSIIKNKKREEINKALIEYLSNPEIYKPKKVDNENYNDDTILDTLKNAFKSPKRLETQEEINERINNHINNVIFKDFPLNDIKALQEENTIQKRQNKRLMEILKSKSKDIMTRETIETLQQRLENTVPVKQYNDLVEEFKTINEENTALKATNKTLKESNTELEEENNTLRGKITEYRAKLQKLGFYFIDQFKAKKDAFIMELFTWKAEQKNEEDKNIVVNCQNSFEQNTMEYKELEEIEDLSNTDNIDTDWGTNTLKKDKSRKYDI